MMVGHGVTLLAVSSALNGVAVGANAPSGDLLFGLRVGGTTAPGDVASVVRLGASCSPSVFLRDGVGVGSSDNATPGTPPIGMLVCDAVGSRPGVDVGLGMSFSPHPSIAIGAHTGTGEAAPPTEFPVGPFVGVAIARSESGATVGPGVFHLPVVSPMDGDSTGPPNTASS